VATEWRLSSAQLHACGLMLGRLTPWIERRVRHGLMGVVLLMGLAGAGVWQHDQQLQTQQRDMSAQLKTLLPVVDDVQALKTQTTLQAQVLGVQEAARAHPIDWGALAGVLNHVPKGAAIQALRLENNELQADLLFVSDKAVVAPWAIPNATHPPLSEVADSRQQGDKGTVRLSYTTPLTTTPQGEP
jgi:hypothetical protein